MRIHETRNTITQCWKWCTFKYLQLVKPSRRRMCNHRGRQCRLHRSWDYSMFVDVDVDYSTKHNTKCSANPKMCLFRCPRCNRISPPTFVQMMDRNFVVTALKTLKYAWRWLAGWFVTRIVHEFYRICIIKCNTHMYTHARARSDC